MENAAISSYICICMNAILICLSIEFNIYAIHKQQNKNGNCFWIEKVTTVSSNNRSAVNGFISEFFVGDQGIFAIKSVYLVYKCIQKFQISNWHRKIIHEQNFIQ